MREQENLPPLEVDKILNRTARKQSMKSADGGAIQVAVNRLPTLIAAGSYARFALSHQIRADSRKEMMTAFAEDPLVRSKILHGRLTHIGIGITKHRGTFFAAVDLARIAPKIDMDAARQSLMARIQRKRADNSVQPLEVEAKLDNRANHIAQTFMKTGQSSEGLIANAQQDLGGDTFALGRVTITFQVAETETAILIPSITSDPALAYIGLGLAQGNHPNHEPGSLTAAIFLAEPQTAHVHQPAVVNTPPLKKVDYAPAQKYNTVDLAWIATLAGNHKKAAGLFKEAYQKIKKPTLLYEAARAYARDRNAGAALSTMRKYADLTTGEQRSKALEMVSRLEKGESIFLSSQQKTMSVEAQRFFAIGKRLFDRGEWDGAIDAFQQAYTYAQHPDIIYNIGLVHSRAGRIGKALQFFDEYQKLVPKANNVEEAKQLFEIGAALFRARQFEVASRYFALSYAYAPFPHLIYNLALCHKAMGKKKAAIRFLREYLDTDPPEADRKEVEKMLRKLAKKGAAKKY